MSSASPSDHPERRADPITPLTQLAWHPAEPPAPITSLIGREREIADIAAMLGREHRADGPRLLTLTGPGGVGKTRLAIAVAAEIAGTFADGVAFVAMAAVRDPDLVLLTIAHALGLRDAGGRPMADQLRSALRRRELLLVLDNLEHLTDAAPQLVALLEACPGLTVLATSRAVLRVSGEHVVAVPPLALPAGGRQDAAQVSETSPAVRLFVARAQAAVQELALRDEDAAAVAEVCRRLDGLPLAIELAAAHVAHLSLPALAARLERRLPLLTAGARDLPARFQTMRETIAWSHDLLDASERALFRRLAVFSGGFTLDAADAVAGGGESVFDPLVSLVDTSLLRRMDGTDGEPRYAMLETIREFAAERLEASGEAEEMRRRHAAWFLDVAETASRDYWARAHDASAVAPLVPDGDNLRAALSWAVGADPEVALRLSAALGLYWYRLGRLGEARASLERTFSLVTPETPPAVRARALVGTGFFASVNGDYARASSLLEAGLAAYYRLGDAWWIAQTQYFLGGMAMRRGDTDAAMTHLEEARSRFAANGDLAGTGMTLNLMTRAAHRAGRIQAATTYAEAGLRLAREAGDASYTARVLASIAQVRAERGDLPVAAPALLESLELTRDIGEPVAARDYLSSLALTAALCGDHLVAARLLGAVDAGIRSQGAAPGDATQPMDQALLYERANRIARTALGEDAFAAAWRDGSDQPLGGLLSEAIAHIRERARNTPSSDAPSGQLALTPREVEVLRLLVAGKSNPEIADVLYISPRTAQSHVTHILAKLGVASRTEAAARAVRDGLV